MIGICGSGGFFLSAVQIDTRIKAVATASMYDISDMHSMMATDPTALETMKKQLSMQRWIDFENGYPEYNPMFPEEPYELRQTPPGRSADG